MFKNNLEKLKWCNAKKNKQRRPDNSLQIFLMTALWISGCIRQLYLLQILPGDTDYNNKFCRKLK